MSNTEKQGNEKEALLQKEWQAAREVKRVGVEITKDWRSTYSLLASTIAALAAIVALILAVKAQGRAEDGVRALEMLKGDQRQGERSVVSRIALIEEERTKLEKAIVELGTKQEAVRKDKADKAELAVMLEEQAKQMTTVTEMMASKVAEKQKEIDSEQNKDIAVTKEALGAVTQRLTYVERRMQVLDAMETDLKSLKGDTSALHGDLKNLRGEVLAVRDKGAATERELVDLDERTHLFQLRILTARAREAANAARKGDLNSLLDKLDIPE
jgi:chromosome segregation ATPase